MTYFTRMRKHDWSQDERHEAVKNGWAMPGGHFPIRSAKDVKDAVDLAHASKLPFSKVKAHIVARAKAIGATGELPDDWKDSKEK